MVKPLFDTNILIDFLNGVPSAREELDRYDERAISVITWMEVLIGAEAAVEEATRRFLAGFAMLSIDDPIADRAVAFRRSRKVKLPDAVIWATAEVHSLLLVTRNEKDFPTDMLGVRVPYRL